MGSHCKGTVSNPGHLAPQNLVKELVYYMQLYVGWNGRMSRMLPNMVASF
jgi:hypothetical protein